MFFKLVINCSIFNKTFNTKHLMKFILFFTLSFLLFSCNSKTDTSSENQLKDEASADSLNYDSSDLERMNKKSEYDGEPL